MEKVFLVLVSASTRCWVDEVSLVHMGSRWWKYKMACKSHNLKLGFRKLLIAKSFEKLSSDLRGCWFRDNCLTYLIY